jgi:hypothetical protein
MAEYLSARYYCIRHKATGELMPQAKRDRGYSHWNPNIPEHEFKKAIDVPRLISTRRKAARCISMWAANPNARHISSVNSYTGEYDDDIDIKPDGRTASDLEIIEVDLIETQ